MKVKCLRVYPTREQIDLFGTAFRKQDFHITVGKQYVVLGLRFTVNRPGPGTGTWVDVFSDSDILGPAPLCLFEITDSRVSRFWEARVWEDGGVTLMPPSFSREYYYDDLFEDVQDVVEDFRRVRRLLESEFL